jgi:ABC-type lipoprotein export system ATPase subunit
MQSLGSVWRKWDLHVHTPASYVWQGQKANMRDTTQATEVCKQIVERMEAIDVDAFAIMDYWTFDGFYALREYLNRNQSTTKKRIFPGIEIRLDAPTNYKLNTHVIFDESLSNDNLALFSAHLSIGGLEDKPPSRENFIGLGRSYDDGKLRVHGYAPADRNDDDKMFILGMKTAVATRKSLEAAMKIVGEENCLLVQPYDTSDGLEALDWKRHPFTDSQLMKWADIFETRDSLHVRLFLGQGHPTKPYVGEEFLHNLGGYPKPAISGSDAHKISDYGNYPSNKITWLKAQPNFAGLRQICNEPYRRCYVGLNPSKRDHIAQNPTKYIRELRIEKIEGSALEEHWFDNLHFQLNPGLIAIIGNKGTGKSALADILALACNSHCEQMEFLNNKRFRHAENKAAHFKASLTWMDGSAPTEVRLDQDADRQRPERVRYLPQQFIETLCNEIDEGDETSFNQELRKVIFSHVPEEKRLQKANLDELIAYRIGSYRKAISQVQGKVRSLNEEIVRIELETSKETVDSWRTALSLKQAELDAHDKTPPNAVPSPGDESQSPEAKKISQELAEAQALLDEALKQMSAATNERTLLATRQALLTRIVGHVKNFEDSYSAFIEETATDFQAASLNAKTIVSLTVNRAPILTDSEQVTSRLAELSLLINGGKDTKGLETQCSETRNTIESLRGQLDAPQERHQQYLSDLRRWETRRNEILGSSSQPESIEYLKARIKNAETLLPTRLTELKEQRIERAREIHAEITNIRGVFEELYKPVQNMATSAEFAQESIQLHFDAFLSASSFGANFLDFIHKNRRGNFYGEAESAKAVEDLLSKHDFNTSDAVVRFLNEVMTLLTMIDKGEEKDPITIQSQLKSGKKLATLYDFLFGLEYVEPRYTLRLGTKPIAQLSPGEKGALLLVFYLLLDREETPIIIDQPEQNLDNESVVKLLVGCIRKATDRRQVIIVTHNPNLAVVCDADQLICMSIDKAGGNRIKFSSGAIEDNPINRATVDVLEGTYPAFDNRRKKYHKPQ